MTFLQLKVSIPSNGSIQFLHKMSVQENIIGTLSVSIPSNGSIQFLPIIRCPTITRYIMSQSPQTGQFNSYRKSVQFIRTIGIMCLNPLKRVNSILTLCWRAISEVMFLSQSPQTGQFNSYQFALMVQKLSVIGLNPLKRVNSILTS